MGEDLRLSLPSVRLDREQFLGLLQIAQSLVSLVAFSVMASAETSRHAEYHYGFYPSLTFFVVVGVCSFVYSLFLVANRQLSLVVDDVRHVLELWGAGCMLWLTYTAAIAASATSTDLHSTFDEKSGSKCRTRRSQSMTMAMAGSYFCSRVVAAIVFMYALCATYFLTLVAAYLPNRASRYVAGAAYDEIDTIEPGGHVPL